MIGSNKHTPMPGHVAQTPPVPVPKGRAVTGRPEFDTIPAAWPTGLSQLVQTIDAIQHGDDGAGGADGYTGEPDKSAVPPIDGPDASDVKPSKPATER